MMAKRTSDSERCKFLEEGKEKREKRDAKEPGRSIGEGLRKRMR